nr:hypothetical protein [uncultured Ralstonia sp.]
MGRESVPCESRKGIRLVGSDNKGFRIDKLCRQPVEWLTVAMGSDVTPLLAMTKSDP